MPLVFTNNFIRHSTTKEKIVFLLSREWPLHAKEVYELLKQHFGLDITYQAVHKLMMQMAQEGILSVIDRRYMLNAQWLRETADFFIMSDLNYKENAFEKDLALLGLDMGSEQPKYLDLANMVQVRNLFWKVEADQRRYMLEIPEEERIICESMRHCLSAVLNPENEHRHLHHLQSLRARQYSLVQGNTLIDRWAKNFYDQHATPNMKIKIGVTEMKKHPDFFVFPRVSLELYYDPLYVREFDSIHERVTDIHQQNPTIFFADLLDKPFRIKAVLRKEREHIEHLKQLVLGQFRDED